jgi:glycosyltransferase involved in cell wall biosynthesis
VSRIAECSIPARVTILTPVYQEEESLEHYIQEVSRVLLDNIEYRFYIILIDDGSSDRSWEMIEKICARDDRFSGLKLSRNYGSHLALSAGLDFASGDCVCTLACDLQDPPETILEFIKKWESGAEIVWGKRKSRDESSYRIIVSDIFYRLIRRYAMPRGSLFTTGSFLLIDKKVLKALKKFGERNRVTFGLVAWTGFSQAVVEYDRRRRTAGKSAWTLDRMMITMYDTFIGFSPLPVRLVTLSGVGAFVLAICVGCYTLTNWLHHDVLSGWSSLMAAITFFFGLQFFLTGITGEYLYRIYSEVVRRPLYILSETINMPEEEENTRG